jgi:glycine/D-amino acid oxidase-like deaminating enzyme
VPKSRRVVIVGAGLGGTLLAHALADTHDVTVVEMVQPDWHRDIVDLGAPAVTEPFVASGWGGSTQAWHNGLIEIAAPVFARHWPFGKSELAPFYQHAWEILGAVTPGQICDAENALRDAYQALGVEADLLPQGLFYPRRRINPWRHLNLSARVNWCKAKVTGIRLREDSDLPRATGVSLLRDGQASEILADIVILAAGGWGRRCCCKVWRLGPHSEARTARLWWPP